MTPTQTTMTRIAIIYHSADYDGILSNEVCRYWLKLSHPGASLYSIGWDYGEPIPYPQGTTGDFAEYDVIYIVDLSFDALMFRPELRDKIVWIDHHKSAIEKWDGRTAPISGNPVPNFDGYRIDGVAACRLCWQWFAVKYANETQGGESVFQLPSKQDFVDCKVDEPTLIRLAGEYDVWDHRDRDAATLQLGLRSLTQANFNKLLHAQFNFSRQPADDVYLRQVLERGEIIQGFIDQ